MRYPLEVPVVFSWSDEIGVHQRNVGRSRDLSEGGAFIFAADSPPIGTEVELKISLLEFPETMHAKWMDVKGRVLRVEPREGKRSGGFAVLAESVIYPASNENAEQGSFGRDQGKAN